MATGEEMLEWGRSYSPLSFHEWLRQRQAQQQWIKPGNYDNHSHNNTWPTQDDTTSRSDVDTTWTHLKTVSKTKLPNGKLSMLVDLGSRINVIGCNTEREFSLEGERHGHKTTYESRKHRLNVNGVGQGSAPCDEEATMPVAVQFQDNPATMETYKANIATGCGADLTAILGSTSMQEKDAVILLRKGKEMIVFPGPGGYKIEWSPGTKRLHMVPAPSGHLVIPCDKFEGAADNNNEMDQILFCTDHTTSHNPTGDHHI